MRACSGQSVPPPPSLRDRQADYQLALSTPLETQTAINMDRATVLQLFSRLFQDLYGTMGGPVALGELDVVAIEPARGGQGQDSQASEVVIRFPAG